MEANVIFLSVPGLREQDLACMPKLTAVMAARAVLVPSFPCVTWPVQANMLTGRLPSEHGVVANGFYGRESQTVEMWTAGNDQIEKPQLWDLLHGQTPSRTSAAWFPMLSKGCGADYICMPAPVHNPDGSESLWCYTRPSQYYGELRDALGHFPLQHFWGPLANIQSTAWIADSAVLAAARYQPRFFYIYLPHLDYAAQKSGPDSPAAQRALVELDDLIGRLVDGMCEAYSGCSLTWLAASEYVVTPVDHVCYPNRRLRQAGLLEVTPRGAEELLDLRASKAWALVDHQFSHVFVRDEDPTVARQVASLFVQEPGIAEVLVGAERAKYALDHPRAGEVILISQRNSWQAYYWWFDDSAAPAYARTVDIHRKPGYDPVELFWDPDTRSVPLDATLVRGSHGAPATDRQQHGVVLGSEVGLFSEHSLRDVDVAGVILRRFGAA